MALRRRSFLALPALAAAGAATTVDVAYAQLTAAPAPIQPLSEPIARFVVETTYDRIPPAAVQAAQRSLLDALGVSMAAAGLEPACKPFTDLAMMEGGAAQATIFGQKGRYPAAGAAFANGALAHALDYEDVHDASGMHPNAAVVPAVLAVAQAQGGVSGRDLITAIAIGCDLACRLGLGRTENLNKYGWYFPPIAGAFGATAAVAKLMKLNAQQVIDALSLTLCQTACSAEIINSPDSTIRAIRDAFPAQTAVRSAYLARAGVRGFDKPFEGENAFITMYAHGRYRADRILAGLGQKFHGDEVSYKAWPACRGTHLYIQASLELMQAQRLDPAAIESIAVVVEPLNVMLCEPFASKRAPSTAIDAKFSIPFTVGTALTQREVTLKSFTPAALANPAVLAVSRRVTHAVDEKVAQTVGAGGGVLMTVTMRDGRVLPCRVDDILGSPGKPMAERDLLAKFFDCAAQAPHAPSPADLERLAAQVMGLESLDDVRKLVLFT